MSITKGKDLAFSDPFLFSRQSIEKHCGPTTLILSGYQLWLGFLHTTLAGRTSTAQKTAISQGPPQALLKAFSRPFLAGGLVGGP